MNGKNFSIGNLRCSEKRSLRVRPGMIFAGLEGDALVIVCREFLQDYRS